MRDDLEKSSIVEVISLYVSLRRSGKEYTGLCPFHSESTPSFSVNEDKGVFHCFGCGAGGDVITFIQKIEGLDFKGAIAHLGLTEETRPTQAEVKKQRRLRQASKNLTAWVLNMSERIGTRMRELGQRAHIAQKILKVLPGADECLLQATIERATREWEMLSTLEEDLLDPKQTGTLWEDRESIEQLVGDSSTYTSEEVDDAFPPITGAYRQRLTRYVRGEPWAET